jgi:4-amino-4-deoxy-L-arabinose transferase-like glycosyltransferase
MVHDWLLSGRLLQPMAYARQYYDHYPYFAVGYWPPLFYVVAGIWFMLAGVGRWQALTIPAVCAAGSAWILFALVRRRAGAVAGFCIGLLYLSLPHVQQSTTMVMIDHVSAFLALTVLVLSLELLRNPSLAGGVRCAVACAAAVLAKYSGLYLCALPFALALFSRRLSLWRKPAFWLQPAIVAAIVGPWAWWTARMAAYGLPPGRHPVNFERALSLVSSLFHMFPGPLLVPVALGLIALLLFPSRWREEDTGATLLAAGSLAFLLISPVGTDEPRYLLVAAAALLVLSAFGWNALFDRAPGTVRRVALVGLAIGTLIFSFFQWGRFPRPAEYPVEALVKAVIGDPRWQGRRIMVPSNLEGPFIAEFAWLGTRNPAYQLVRPNKVFASQSWFGTDYTSRVGSPEEMMTYLGRNPVSLILWQDRPLAEMRPHERVMSAMLHGCAAAWRPVFSLRGGGPETSAWTVFEYVPQRH